MPEEGGWREWESCAHKPPLIALATLALKFFNTRKTPFLIKIVLQRGKNTGGTVGDPGPGREEKEYQRGRSFRQENIIMSLYDLKYCTRFIKEMKD